MRDIAELTAAAMRRGGTASGVATAASTVRDGGNPMTHKPRMLVHTSRQPIRWGDMDALGHVNNTVYFRYLEQARIEWLYGLHADGEAYDRTGPVIVNASCTFLEPLVYPGDIEVRMYLGDLGRIERGQLLRDLDERQKIRGRRREDGLDRSCERSQRAAAGGGCGAAAGAGTKPGGRPECAMTPHSGRRSNHGRSR